MGELYFHARVIEEDLRLIGRQDIPAIFKKLRILSTNVKAGYPLGGELTGFRKLIIGAKTYRVVYRVADKHVEICEIWAIGHRRNDSIYRRAVDRVRTAAITRPELLDVAKLMELVTDLDGVDLIGASRVEADPVPEWLYAKLIHIVGMPTHEVAAMTGAEAFERWNEWICRERLPASIRP